MCYGSAVHQRTMRSGDIRKERLACHVVQDDSFDAARQVGIDPFLAQELVVLDVIPLESHGVRHADSQVGKDSEDLVGPYRPECEVVRDFVDGKKGILVGCSSDSVRSEEELPGEGMGGAEGVCQG